MLKLDYDVAPVLPEDPDDHVRDEGHDDDEETEQPDWQRGEDDRVDSDRNTTHIISVRGNENSQKSFKFCLLQKINPAIKCLLDPSFTLF